MRQGNLGSAQFIFIFCSGIVDDVAYNLNRIRGYLFDSFSQEGAALFY